jgi:abequosyltransferase
MSRPSLAIAIPTYCRPEMLRENLLAMTPDLRQYNVAVYVSDDSPDDRTRDLVLALSPKLPKILYRQNSPSLGHDANLLGTLAWPTEDFIWLLGDSGRVTSQGFEGFFQLASDQDMIFANVRSHHVEPAGVLRGKAAKDFAKRMLWHQTLTGATIYHQRVTKWSEGMVKQPSRIKRNFPQLSVALGYMDSHETSLSWINGQSLSVIKRVSYWRSKSLQVFVDDWSELVTSFPNVISPADYTDVIKSHSQKTNLFNAIHLMTLREEGQLSKKYADQSKYFFDAMHVSRWKISCILLIPRWILRILRKLTTSRPPVATSQP